MEQNINSLRMYCQEHKVDITMVIEIIKRVSNHYDGKYGSFTIIGPNCGNPLADDLAEYISIPGSSYRIMLFSNTSTDSAQIKCNGDHNHEFYIINAWAELANRGLSEDEKWRNEETMVIIIFESVYDQESLMNLDELSKQYKIICNEKMVIFHLTAQQARSFDLHTKITKKLKGQSVKYCFNPITHFTEVVG